MTSPVEQSCLGSTRLVLRPTSGYFAAVNSPLAIALDALYLALRLTLPLLGVAFVVAALVGLVQALTQLREPVLNGIARMLSVGLVLALSFGALSGELVAFTGRLYRALPTLLSAL